MLFRSSRSRATAANGDLAIFSSRTHIAFVTRESADMGLILSSTANSLASAPAPAVLAPAAMAAIATTPPGPGRLARFAQAVDQHILHEGTRPRVMATIAIVPIVSAMGRSLDDDFDAYAVAKLVRSEQIARYEATEINYHGDAEDLSLDSPLRYIDSELDRKSVV